MCLGDRFTSDEYHLNTELAVVVGNFFQRLYGPLKLNTNNFYKFSLCFFSKNK